MVTLDTMTTPQQGITSTTEIDTWDTVYPMPWGNVQVITHEYADGAMIHEMPSRGTPGATRTVYNGVCDCAMGGRMHWHLRTAKLTEQKIAHAKRREFRDTYPEFFAGEAVA